MSDVSRETGLLASYQALLRKWNPTINLVSPLTLEYLETRHIADCAALAQVSRGFGGTWVDLGSGGGLPGLVIAIYRPDMRVTMVESDRRKGSFLRTAIRELGLSNVEVICERIEKLDGLNAANVSARALAPLSQLMAYVVRHMEDGGRAWLMKGRNWPVEVAEARREWRFDMRAHPSATDPDAAILEITGICHA